MPDARRHASSAARPSTASASTTARPIEESPAPPVDVAEVLRDAQADVLVAYLPVGSEQAQKHYAQAAMDAGVAFVNAIPVFIASDPEWAQKFTDAGLPDRRRRHQEPGRRDDRPPRSRPAVRRPRAGARPHLPAQLRRQHGLQEHAGARAARVEEDLEDPVGHEPDRPGHLSESDVHIGPSDHVPWLDDRKWAYIRMEGRNFGDVPLNIELKLEVWDSPNSAGVIIDALRCAKIGLDRGIGGPLIGPSAYFMKSPPVQYHDDDAHRMVEEFANGTPVPSSSEPRPVSSTRSYCP